MSVKRSSKKVVVPPRRARHERHGHKGATAASRLESRVATLERKLSGNERRGGVFELTARMRKSLIASFVFHVIVIVGIGIPVPPKPSKDRPNQQLEVVLVNAKSQTKPAVADVLAQANLDGGGNTEEKRRAQTPLPAVNKDRTDAEMQLALKRVEQLEREARQVLTQQKAAPAPPVETAPPSKAAPKAEPAEKPEPNATDLLQRSLEIARLEARIAREWQAYQERPRRKFIGARAQESRFARYVEDWRQKIERIGDLNYPPGAREQRLHGRLLVTVAIRSNGTVEEVSIDRSSGHKVLDEGARRIVQLAAPFAPFPPDIAKDVDVLHITRTWTFTTGDKFVSE